MAPKYDISSLRIQPSAPTKDRSHQGGWGAAQCIHNPYLWPASPGSVALTDEQRAYLYQEGMRMLALATGTYTYHLPGRGV